MIRWATTGTHDRHNYSIAFESQELLHEKWTNLIFETVSKIYNQEMEYPSMIS
jgi:hypothetical protein